MLEIPSGREANVIIVVCTAPVIVIGFAGYFGAKMVYDDGMAVPPRPFCLGMERHPMRSAERQTHARPIDERRNSRLIRRACLLVIALLMTGAAARGAETASTTRFVIISDIHYYFQDRKDCDWCEPSRGALADALRFVQETVRPDFVIFLGDAIAGEGATDLNEKDTRKLLQRFVSVVERTLKMPFYSVKGNHDGPNFQKVFGYTNKTFTAGGYRFYLAGIDYTNYWSGMGQFKEWQMLDQALDAKEDMPALFFIHNPIFPFTFDSALKLKKRLDDSRRVKVVFQGHVHYEQTTRNMGIMYFTCDEFSKAPRFPFYEVRLNGGTMTITRYEKKDGKYGEGVKALETALK